MELRSKCCGAEVYEEADNETLYTEWYHRETYCSKCHKPTEVEEKEEEKK